MLTFQNERDSKKPYLEDYKTSKPANRLFGVGLITTVTGFCHEGLNSQNSLNLVPQNLKVLVYLPPSYPNVIPSYSTSLSKHKFNPVTE